MKNKKPKHYEVDLYEPIQQYFTKKGYNVYGEVNDCDVVAVKDEELIIIELKVLLSINLLIQATKRQRLSKQVYIAIPKPTYSIHSKKWKDICYLIRRLEMGLLIVSFDDNESQVNAIIEPEPFDRVKSMARSIKRRKKLITEISGRHIGLNIGGSTQTKIMTAYKESCIHIACYLEQLGPQSPKNLRQMGTVDNTQSILSANHYGWFDRIKRGTYKLSDKGLIEYKKDVEVFAYYKDLISNQLNN